MVSRGCLQTAVWPVMPLRGSGRQSAPASGRSALRRCGGASAHGEGQRLPAAQLFHRPGDVLVPQLAQHPEREAIERCQRPRQVALARPAGVLARLAVAHAMHAVFDRAEVGPRHFQQLLRTGVPRTHICHLGGRLRFALAGYRRQAVPDLACHCHLLAPAGKKLLDIEYVALRSQLRRSGVPAGARTIDTGTAQA